ncbi:threonine/serine exporter family protein [Aureibacter tunicatorum]|uniref:Uncharacterized membrane protein YjjB (DUF3815 family) n=1 Tax=Aureibacter tunicatorum TaxID=866807 RepID=A0AAE3XME4_9BACT|nr:threonine/serine exporter family protein [Aureibacter tunicatorum]MDR6239122.1 uncharacterized membrane protein YjjB (DUF3815 family) [Aureibacter tunicatorum]BDD04952.1 hypothetical protein AUTU_24350 [Aureibacter tunicatorum]
MILKLAEELIWVVFIIIGFSILFNLNRKAIPTTCLLGIVGYIVRFLFIQFHWGNIVLGSFFGSITIGILAISIAHKLRTLPLIFAVCSLIPMVPGYFAYNALILSIKLINQTDLTSNLTELYLIQASVNAIKASLIFLGISVGLFIPIMTYKTFICNNKLSRHYD